MAHSQISDWRTPRRSFLSQIAATGLPGVVLTGAGAAADSTPMNRPATLFLDVNETLLDLAPLKKSVGAVLDGREELLPIWFTTMLQYSLVLTVSGQYQNFGEIGNAALRMVAANNGIELSKNEAGEALQPIRSLSPHPDVAPALKKLRDSGFDLVSLTNSSRKGVEEQMENSGLQQYLTGRLSVEDVGLYKPHTRVYQWAAEKVGHPIGDCLLVAAHGWDIAGARWAGMRAAFLSRPGAQLYPSAPAPEFSAPDLGKAAERLLQLEA